MAYEVFLRKLIYLRRLITDLAPYQEAPQQVIQSEHYKIERIFELLVVVASDILFHLLAEEDITATTYRSAFEEAFAQGWLPEALAKRLQQAAGMRNIIVHMYEAIDYSILHSAIEPAVQDFSEFLAIFEARLDE